MALFSLPLSIAMVLNDLLEASDSSFLSDRSARKNISRGMVMQLPPRLVLR